MPGNFGANMSFTEQELAEIFDGAQEQQSPAVDKPQDKPTTDTKDKPEQTVDTTKAFAHRLKEEKEKAKEEIAKSLGYDSYSAMMKKRDEELISSKGLNPDDVAPIVEELVNKRISEDPRMKELESFRKEQLKLFAEKELSQIKELTGGEISSLDQLSKEVIDEWKKTGSLKSAYLAIEGENLIKKAQSSTLKGTTNHLNNLSGSPSPETNMRPLNDKEREMWKRFNPQITDEELNKKMVEK